MDRSLRFRVYPLRLDRPIQTCFRYGYEPKVLNLSPQRETRWLIKQKARGQASRRIALPQFVSARFQGLFHSPSGVLFTFPSRYLFTIGHGLVFSLARWSSQIPAGLHVSRRTWDPFRAFRSFAYGAITLSGGAFLHPSARSSGPTSRSHNPGRTYSSGLGCSDFARRYSRNRYCFLFLQILRCFSSLGIASHAYVFSMGFRRFPGEGFPHSEIPGSTVVCTFPRLIAACRVLHRLPVPRHPPYALSNLKNLRSNNITPRQP